MAEVTPSPSPMTRERMRSVFGEICLMRDRLDQILDRGLPIEAIVTRGAHVIYECVRSLPQPAQGTAEQDSIALDRGFVEALVDYGAAVTSADFRKVEAAHRVLLEAIESWASRRASSQPAPEPTEETVEAAIRAYHDSISHRAPMSRRGIRDALVAAYRVQFGSSGEATP